MDGNVYNAQDISFTTAGNVFCLLEKCQANLSLVSLNHVKFFIAYELFEVAHSVLRLMAFRGPKHTTLLSGFLQFVC